MTPTNFEKSSAGASLPTWRQALSHAPWSEATKLPGSPGPSFCPFHSEIVIGVFSIGGRGAAAHAVIAAAAAAAQNLLLMRASHHDFGEPKRRLPVADRDALAFLAAGADAPTHVPAHAVDGAQDLGSDAEQVRVAHQ